MGDLIAHIAIADVGVEPLGVKEALVMAVEHLGGVRVLSVELQEPEQTSMRVWPENPSRPKPPPPKPVGQAPAPKPPPPENLPSHKYPRPQPPMECCFNCARYRSDRNQDANGDWYWGVCGRSGQLVYELREHCPAWARLGG